VVEQRHEHPRIVSARLRGALTSDDEYLSATGCSAPQPVGGAASANGPESPQASVPDASATGGPSQGNDTNLRLILVTSP
jgi:hypothetical protein